MNTIMPLAPTLLYTIILGGFFFSILLDYLNLKNLSQDIPKEFQGIYDPEKYSKSQSYLKTNTYFSWVSGSVTTLIFLFFISLSGFQLLDQLIRSWSDNEIVRGLLFIGALSLAGGLLGLPFKLYNTFVIEEKFGFNKMSLKTFFTDQLKGILLGAILGGLVLALLLWFFMNFTSAWLWAWIFITLFQLFMMFIAPVTIMPLFNKFIPLEEGPLKTEIEAFAKKENFKLSGLFKMDGSKRSTKANAYFTGFGKYRRIVLFDTLIQSQTTDELVAVLAHEIGHYKLKHIFRQLFVSLFSSFITFYLLGLFINNDFIFSAFGVEQKSIYASLLFFGVFYSPISSLISLWSLYLSRKYEFEADSYARQTYGKPESLVNALKKLTVDNLSNLKPHPWKVFFEYTHPPVLKRIEALRSEPLRRIFET